IQGAVFVKWAAGQPNEEIAVIQAGRKEMADQSRLPDARFACHDNGSPLSRTRTMQAIAQNAQFCLPSIERRQFPPCTPTFPHLPNDAPRIMRLREAANMLSSELFTHERATDPGVGIFRDDYAARRCQPLQSCCQIRCRTDN